MNNTLSFFLYKKLKNLQFYLPIKSFYIIKNEIILICLPKNIPFISYFLSKQTYLQFKLLNFITVADHINRFYRFELIYDFLSIKFNIRLRLKTYLSELSGTILTITNYFQSANWWEREIYDLFGIYFQNNLNLNVLLLDYGFEGFPLKKDYPVSGYFEIYYNTLQKSFFYDKLEISQDCKNLNIYTSWNI